ncbi:MAG: 6-phospho-beta-glucosidase [Microbacteriaceae bacterium]
MKLAIVGGGSTYTPELVDGFARLRDVLPLEELWLVDPDESRLDLVGGVARRMFARAGHPGRVIGTTDLIAGVADADAVLIQLRVGGQDARRGDETWPHEVHCIGQETTGPGGFAKALRTVPVVLKVAEAVRAHAKQDAWIVDFTNPVGIVTRALLNEGHRAVGLCNVAIGFQRRFAGMLGVAPDEVSLGHAGLNHLTWIRSVTQGGADRLPEFFDRFAEDSEQLQVARLIGAIPSYYLRYYYHHDLVLDEQLHSPSRADAVQAVERELLELYADPSVDTKPEALERRGGAFYSEAAIELLSGLVGGVDQTRVVNLRNGTTLPFLPEDHVVEVPARVTAAGVEALPVPAFADDIRGLISAVAGYERLALDAAVHGGRERVLRAMQAHPLVLQYERAEKLTALLIAHNAEHLAWA